MWSKQRHTHAPAAPVSTARDTIIEVRHGPDIEDTAVARFRNDTATPALSLAIEWLSLEKHLLLDEAVTRHGYSLVQVTADGTAARLY